MRIVRLHTRPDADVFDGVRLHATARETWQEYVVPKAWDEAAVQVLLEKIFCRDPLPAETRAVAEDGVPAFLWRHAAVPGAPLIDRAEKDIRAVLHRLAGSWAYAAWKNGVFDSEDDARAFYDEARHLLLHRKAAPEIAVWAGAGLDWAYGLPPRAIVFAERTAPPPPPASALKRFDILARQNALEEKKSCALLPVSNIESGPFIRWKTDAAAASVARDLGLKALRALLHRVMDACDRDAPDGFDPAQNPALDRAVDAARKAGVDSALIANTISYARQGYEDIPLPQPEDGNSADGVVSVLSVPDAFIEAALTGHGFMQVENGVEQRRIPAERLWDSFAEAVWTSGEPQAFFEDSAKAASSFATLSRSGGGLVAPPDMSAPSAALDLLKLETRELAHAAGIMTVALDAMAEAPLRPVVLGVANLAGFLMRQGLAYHSDAGRTTAALAVALVSGAAHGASAALARTAGAFEGYAALEKPFLRGLQNRIAAFSPGGWIQKDILRRPVQLHPALCPDRDLAAAALEAWTGAYEAGRGGGFRNAHLTGLSDSPETQALLGAGTRGIAPEGNLVSFDALYGRRLNPLAAEALQRLGYGASEIDDIHFHVLGHGTLLDAPFINHRTLKARGFHQAALDALESALKTAQHIRYAFNKWTLGPDFCLRMLEIGEDALDAPDFDMLTALGFSEEEIGAASLYCCGAMTLDGAPRLKPRDRAVFDAAVQPEARIRMQAAVEPFLSGGAAQTVPLDGAVAVEAVQKLILKGWELGVKSLSLYRQASAAPAAAAERAEDAAAEPRRAAS